MKSTKKPLALLLTLALAFALVLPATAAVDWSEFRITKQPQNLTIKQGDSFTLSVEVNVPEGFEVEYQWRRMSGGSTNIEGATSPELHLGPNDSHYPTDSRYGGDSVVYECWITAYVKNADDIIVLERRISSGSASVQTKRTVLGKILDVTIAPFWYAFGGVMATPVVSIPLFPFAYLFWLVLAYVSGFRALFS